MEVRAKAETQRLHFRREAEHQFGPEQDHTQKRDQAVRENEGDHESDADE